MELPYIRENYYVSGNDLGNHGYGILMLTRFDCWIYEKKYVNTQMARSVLLAEVIGHDLIVGTSHFESMENP